MGFSLKKIIEEVDDMLKCGICGQLLEKPVQISECEHMFCADCIKSWLSKQLKCPIDSRPVTHSQIRAAPKLIIPFISKLNISCDFVSNGCSVVVNVNQINDHINDCEFNPKNQIRCSNSCGALLPISQSSTHICPKSYSTVAIDGQKFQIESLETKIKEIEIENSLLRKDLYEVKKDLNEVKNDLNEVKKVLGLDLKVSEPTSKGKLIVKIDDKTLVIDVDPHEQISKIKQKVEQIENICGNDLLVFFSNKELDENKTLVDYHIYRLFNPIFIFMVKKNLKILVRLDNERKFEMNVSPKDTVGKVLAQILKKEVLNSKEFVLTFRNHVLDESRTLFSYKIRDGNFVFLNTKDVIQKRNVF